MRHILITLMLIIAGAQPGWAEYRDTAKPLKTVPDLDVPRYMGRWYEIARFPISFEKDCINVTADYTLRDDGKVGVVNTCTKSTTGQTQQAKGLAVTVAPGVLKVSFIPVLKLFALLSPNYYLLDISDSYDLAVIGTPKGNAGWILARSPEIPKARLDAALKILQNNGYDTSQILLVSQRKE